MKPEQLRQEITIELESIESIVRELASLQRDITGRKPTVRETTAAAAFLAQFYNGLENILKRISRFYDVPLPSGETWHLELFDRFCSPPYDPLPALFTNALAAQ